MRSQIQTRTAMIVSIIGLMLATSAEAGVTCKIVPSWCPSDTNTSNSNSGSSSGSGGYGTKTTSVPEPGSLLLLGTGVMAVGALAVRRRRK